MATLTKLQRAERRIPTSAGLDVISQSGAAAGAVKFDPQGMGVQAPQINVRGFLDEARGAAVIGQGIQQVGGAMFKLAEEQAQAVALRQKLDFESQLGSIETELATGITAEPDELKWGTILEGGLEKAKMTLEAQPMAGIAKQESMAALSRWEKQQRHNITIQQARRSFDRVREGISARVTQQMTSRNWDGVTADLQAPEVAKYMGEDWAATQQSQLAKTMEADAEKTRYDQNFTELTQDPDTWLEANSKPWDDNAPMWQRLTNQAQARKGEISSGAVDAVLDDIMSGQITHPGEIDVLTDPGLTPALREKLKADVYKYDKVQSDVEKAENGERNWLDMWKRVRAWPGGSSDKAALEYYDMMRDTRYGVPDDQQGKISELLYRKMGLTKSPSPEPEVMQAADKIIDLYYNTGVFNQGKPIKTKNPDGTEVIDRAAVEKSAGIEGRLRQDLRRYLIQHPEDADPVRIQGVIQQLLPSTVRAHTTMSMDSFYRAPKPPATPAQTESQFNQQVDSLGLPLNRDGEDPIDANLLPQIPN